MGFFYTRTISWKFAIDSKFGVYEAQAEEAIKQINSRAHTNLKSFPIFIETNVLNYKQEKQRT